MVNIPPAEPGSFPHRTNVLISNSGCGVRKPLYSLVTMKSWQHQEPDLHQSAAIHFCAVLAASMHSVEPFADEKPASPDSSGAIAGHVFDDRDRDGIHDTDEAGVAGVLVSNGRDWARTDEAGRYRIAIRPDMDLTIVQPAGWRVPVDERQVPQFFYVHKPGGSPHPLRFGGLPDTGPMPAKVDFPLMRRAAPDRQFGCAIIGDAQTYSNREIGWLRDGVFTDLAAAGLGEDDCLLYVGDVVGDDLELLDRVLEIGASLGRPQWLVHGNHDFDFDARSDADSADSWRRIYGPNYYAFERGQALFVVLDNVIYPCRPEDGEPVREFCEDPEEPTYNGRISEVQMQWLAGLLERTPEDRLIVLAHHIPMASLVDHDSARHQTDNAGALHDLLEGRPALSLSGHTHTIENHAPGQHFAGWQANAGIEQLPFRHIIAGAASGAWFQGDYNVDGNPMALQRMGAPPGVLMLDFDGTDYRERYIGARIDPDRGQWVGLNTPAFRQWFEAIMEWKALDESQRDPLPPRSIQDLADTGIVTPDDLAKGVWLTANVWGGSVETRVRATLSDGRALVLERTQAGAGEAPRIGAEWADPFAASRQLSVARWAFESRSEDPRAQGFELFRGNAYGPAAPQPQGAVADRNMHLWRARLPQDLAPGVHTARVTSTDRNDRVQTDPIVFEVRQQRPPRHARTGIWKDDPSSD